MTKKYLDYTGLDLYNDKIEETYINKESKIKDNDIDSLFSYQGDDDLPIIPGASSALIDDDNISSSTVWSSQKITDVLQDYEKYIKIKVNLIGSEGNVPLGNSIQVYELIDNHEILLMTTLVATGTTIIRVPIGIEYKIIASTDVEGFYMPMEYIGVANEDSEASIRYTELAYPRTMRDLQTLAKMGVADKVVSIGDEFNSTYRYGNTDYECPWIVIDIKDEEFEDGHIGQCVTLEMKYCTIESIQFDAPHQELATEETAIEGLTYVGRTDNTYTLLNLSTGDSIPYSDYTYVYHDAVRDTSLNIYRYGHNRVKDSAARQWINSNKEAGEWYTPPEVGCCKPSQANSQRGFLFGLSQEIIDCAARTKRTYYTNSISDKSVIDVLYDKFFLLTGTELFGSVNENEGVTSPYYKEVTGLDSASNSNNTGRIKYALNAHASSQHCWQFSASRSYSIGVWGRSSAGQLLNFNYASTSYRAAVACRIG